MKIVLAGAFGKLGSDILRALCATDYTIIAADAVLRIPADVDPDRFAVRQIDVTDPKTLKGLCDGADVVITTVGLTGASTQVTNYDIDYQGNMNLLKAAKKAGVKHFAYISVINADQGEGVPMVHSKYLMEQQLKKSGMTYVIYRPTGYFYDIAHVFWPMIKTKSVQLLHMKSDPIANVVDTKDFAGFILDTMLDENVTYNVGGQETYTYREIAEMFYNADGVVDGPVKEVPPFTMDALARLPKIKKSGRTDIIKFSKFTMTHDCYGDTEIEGRSFKEYIAGKSYAPAIEAEMEAKKAAEEEEKAQKAEKKPTPKVQLPAIKAPQREFSYVTDKLVRDFTIIPLDAGDAAVMKVRPMKVTLDHCMIQGCGHLVVMKMTAPGGLMQMDTVILTPTAKDAPIFSYDRIRALGNETLIIELYDTLLDPAQTKVYDDLKKVKPYLNRIPEYDLGEHWYDSLKLPASFAKKGRKCTDLMDRCYTTFFNRYLVHLKNAPDCDPEDKREMSLLYVNGLFENGGPATDAYVKSIGREAAEKLFKEVVFGIDA